MSTGDLNTLKRAIRAILLHPYRHSDFLQQVLEDEMSNWTEEDLKEVFLEES